MRGQTAYRHRRRVFVMLLGVLLLGCTQTSWKTIDEPKWGFRLDVPRTVQEKDYPENRDWWTHEDDRFRIIVDFGRKPTVSALREKQNYTTKEIRQSGFDATIDTYTERSNSKPYIAQLTFRTWPKVYGEGSVPFFRVEVSSERDLETAIDILQSFRFYQSVPSI